MTRANTEQIKHTPWFAKAGAACSIVPISRFVGPNIFALKGGGYGCLFFLTGLDEEGLTDVPAHSLGEGKRRLWHFVEEEILDWFEKRSEVQKRPPARSIDSAISARARRSA